MDGVTLRNGQKTTKKIRMLSPYVITVGILLLSAIVCFILFSYSKAFSDFIQTYVGGPIRFILAQITNLIPFSLAELMLLSAPVIFFWALRLASKKYVSSWYLTGCFAIRTLCVLAIILIIFVFGFAGGYKGKTVADKLGFEQAPVSPQDLKYTAQYLVNEMNDLTDEIGYVPNSSSLMPYSFREMTDKLNDAYKKLSSEHSFIQSFYSRPKQVVLSEPWTYTHIAGVYTFFTGESNVNINFPDYTLPYTCAHEMAHQRGISREDEANFIAFLVCDASDDPYIRYSGYLNLYEYVSNALYSADKDLYYEVSGSVATEIRYEMRAYSSFFEKYRDTVVADVSQSVNNSFLQSQGTVGTKSYGMVVDLACAYIKSISHP